MISFTVKFDEPLAVQVCDGPDGCGRVINDRYETPQNCSWQRHPGYERPKDRPWVNAPQMRKTTVVITEGSGTIAA